jgi:hypothetical protein
VNRLTEAELLELMKDEPPKQAVKFDTEKPQLQWLPYESLCEVAKVMEYGAGKYGNRNWQAGMKWSRMIGASLRHIFAWMNGEDKDSETGLSHLAHAATCLMFLLWYEKHHPQLDDRKEDV